MADPLLATVVIPMRNEEDFIVQCIESLCTNSFDGEIEFLVYDGASDDRSRELVAQLAATDPRIVLLENPRKIQAAAFNDAVQRARGEYFVRADAHSLYPANYIAECVRLLQSTGAENVGGIQQAAGLSWLGRAIAAAVSSRFAAGDAKYRYASEPAFTDTVYLGSWRTTTLRDLGGMREDWAVNEDYEMNVRLRAQGGRVYLSPSIRSTYYVRPSLAKLARQYARYGFWRVRTVVEHPASLRWRQLVAPAFVVSLVAAWPLTHWFGPIGAAHLCLYVVANLGASAVTAARSSWRNFALLPGIFLTIHLSWGAGFLAGLGYWPLHSEARA